LHIICSYFQIHFFDLEQTEMKHSSPSLVVLQDTSRPASQSASGKAHDMKSEELDTPIKYAGSKFHTTSPSPNSLPIPLTILSTKTTRSSSLSESTTTLGSSSLPSHYLTDTESLRKKESKSDAENPFVMATNPDPSIFLSRKNQKLKVSFDHKKEAPHHFEKPQTEKKEENRALSRTEADRKKSMSYHKHVLRQGAPAKAERPFATTTMMTPKILKNTARHSLSHSHHTHPAISHPNLSNDTPAPSNVSSSQTKDGILSKAHSKEHTHLHVLSDNLKQMLKIVDSPMA